ncbi:MAG: hypothetical protein OEQ53_17610, partial [Saprospiraceae bacterium]|nr:hypothetical protein [Saprospiraceae bacterium]
MISIWHDQYHVSYDLQKCNLYKIWTGGIHWDGAAFNNIKTVQPSTWGAVVLHDTTAWQIEGESNTQVDYLGYNVEASSLQFNYEVNPTDGTSIPITEKVAFIQTNDSVHLQITFSYDQTEDFQIRRNGQTIYGSRKFSFPQQVEAPTTNPALGTWSQYWLDRSGCNTCHNQAENTVGPSYENIASRYENTEEVRKLLAARIKAGSIGQWGATPMIPHPNLGEQDLAGMVRYILSLRPQKTAPTQVYQPSEQYLPVHQKPGFGAALEGIHPSYTLSAIRPEGFEPRVGGMDFDKDGNLYISTWDNAGAVYKLSGLGFDDVNRIKIQQIANGLAEPLGLKIVDEELFVVQKNELTQLVDHNSDGITDEYRSICDAFDVSADFHEYSYGLEFLDGHFYLTLGLAMRLMAHERQLRDRGTMIKVARDGSYEIFATGLRQPNGIGLVDGYKLFSTENQGQWVPACKLINIRKGDHYGCQFQTGLRYSDSKITPPVVWLPQDEIGNSPSQPVPVRDGPYRGQILFGEVTHGGIKRVFLEEVSGALQGCVFRFTQGLESGVNRLAWGP